MSLLSCLAYVVQTSQLYSSVLMTQATYAAIYVSTVMLEFIHTPVARRARVVAAVPILLSISLSKEKLPVMVEPRYVNWFVSSMVMIGGVSVFCVRTFVFFRLTVHPKSLEA